MGDSEHTWWDELTPTEQDQYLKDHPLSKKQKRFHYDPSLVHALDNAPKLGEQLKKAIKKSDKPKAIEKAKKHFPEKDADALKKIVQEQVDEEKDQARYEREQENHTDTEDEYTDEENDQEIPDDELEDSDSEEEPELPSKIPHEAKKLVKRLLIGVAVGAVLSGLTVAAFSAHPLILAYLVTDLHHSAVNRSLSETVWSLMSQEHYDPYDAAYKAILDKMRYPTDDELTQYTRDLRD